MSTQTIKKQSAYSEAFRVHQERLNGIGAPWLERLRASAFDRFEQLDFPTTSAEDWKYTNLAPLAGMNFMPDISGDRVRGAATGLDLEPFSYSESCRSQLVFVNGTYDSELSRLDALPEGVVVLDLANAVQDPRYADIIREHLAREADYNSDGLIALNTAFFTSGAFVLIPSDVSVSAPVHILFLSDPGASNLVTFPRLLVIAERGSSARLIESYASTGDLAYWTNAVVEIVLRDGARLEHYKLQHESMKAFHTATTNARPGREGVFDSTTITLGAKLSRHDIKIRLEAEGADCHVDGLYLVASGQHTDTHSLIDHLKPHCTSRQLYKGILDGKSRAVFNGKVFVHKDAQLTDAQQTNRNLLLSKDARVDTKPQLEIFADDVKCSHGATVGQLEEEELFYLVSRGLHPELAQNLLTFGFAEEVIDKIKIESIKAQLGGVVLNRLHAKLEV